MLNLYKKTDIKNPKNSLAFSTARFSFDSILDDFQKFAYTIQLAEQVFMQKKLENSENKMVVWVKDPSKFIPLKAKIEDFFTSFFEYDVHLDILDANSSPMSQTRLVSNSPNFHFICLFSGGLDSGTFALANVSKKGILHHTITHDIPFGKSRKLFFKHLRNSRLKLTCTREENKVTQPLYLKTRGLIFLTNMLCMASHFQIKTAIIPENGPFMINIPISPSSEPTRTTDPEMIREWTEIFNKITNSKIKTDTPFLEKTKSEVIILGGNRNFISDTWSCSYFQGLKKMCGMCNSCLVRILSCYAIQEGERIEQCYMVNPFLISVDKIKTTNKNSYRISLDAINFWAGIIDPSLAINKIEKERFESIRSEFPVMLNHSLDMFLGFQNLMKRYTSTEPIFVNFKIMLDKLDHHTLKNRSFSLQRQKVQVNWK